MGPHVCFALRSFPCVSAAWSRRSKSSWRRVWSRRVATVASLYRVALPCVCRQVDNYYYWFGENRNDDFTFKSIDAYRSRDLKTWELTRTILSQVRSS